MIYSKGISWITDTRIPFVDEGDIPNNMDKTHLEEKRTFIEGGGYMPFFYKQNQQGRFTPNLLVCDDMLNDGNIYKSGDGKGMSLIKRNGNTDGVCKMDMGYSDNAVHYGDKGTNSRYYNLDLWFNKMVDEL